MNVVNPHIEKPGAMILDALTASGIPSNPLIYVILVNWNCGEFAVSCLASLRDTSYPNYRVLVVDNASPDGSADRIAALHPDISLLRLTHNIGFTGANNVGFAHALECGADYVYLLNADTRVAPDFLTEAVTTAKSCSSIGVVGSKILHANRPDVIQFAGGRANLTTGHNGRPFGHDQIDSGQFDYVTDVDWVTGCALMVSRSCLEAVGGLDNAFFAFHEDVDLCLRARQAGFRVVMSPLSRVWHHGGGSMGGAATPGHMYYSVRNALRLVQIHKPAPNKVTGAVRAACILSAHIAQVALSKPSRPALGAIISGARDYYRGISNARPSH